MILTVGEIITITQTINQIGLFHQVLPMNIAIKLKRLVKRLRVEVELHEEVKQELISKYAKKNEDGSPKLMDNKFYEFENPTEFSAAYTSILKEEINIDFEPIPASVLEDINISAGALDALDKIIIE
jgi:hypothetical protein